jgi:5-methyltetrahydrofolate--homocysteine methyltransferase
MELSRHLQNGEDQRVCDLTREAIAGGFPPSEILDRALLPGIAVVGARFRNREIFLPDVLFAARAMHGAMTLLKPLLVRENIPPAGKVVLGSVTGDIHDIGKNLVGFLLQGAGFEVIDLGTDVGTHEFVDAAAHSRGLCCRHVRPPDDDDGGDGGRRKGDS